MMQNVKTIGKSRFVLGFLGAIIIGIFLGDKIMIDFGWTLGIIGGIIVAILMFWKEKFRLLISITLLGLFLGLFYYHYWDFRENKKTLTYNQAVTIDAWISQKPVRDSADQKIIISYKKTKVQVTIPKYPEYNYGDQLEIKGTIKNPGDIKSKEGEFSYGNYLLKKGIRGEIKNPESIKKVGTNGNSVTKIVYKIGDKFESTLNQVLAEPYAALQAGIILGAKRNIPDSLMSAFNRDGLTHIVAVSGYNLMIVVSALALIFMPFSRRFAFWGSICFIIFFTILTGAPASVLRAAVLAILVLWCKILGRRPYYPILILLAGVLMLLFNPYALKNDLSFQLSFLAFIGLTMLSPKISSIRIVNKSPNIIKSAFSETISAQILVLPILLLNFGILSFVAPLANILVLPTVPTSMFLGFLAGGLGIIYLPLGRLVGLLAFIVLKYIIVVTEFLSRFSFSAVTLKTNDWWWLPVYYLIIYLIFRGVKNAEDIKR